MRKFSVFQGTAFLFFFFQSCSPKLIPFSAEVNFIRKDAQGTIILNSLGYGSDLKSAKTDAEKNAFKVVLFRGIPGTELNLPLVTNETESKSRNKDYYKGLFEEEKYKSFMMYSNESSDLIKLKGVKRISVDLKINYNSLRKDLEQNNITKKFGF